MTPEQWHTIREALGEALDLDPTGRDSYLASLRERDPDVAKEVESLIAAHALADEVVGIPSLEELEAPRFAPGTRLGEYEIGGLLGTGGMGEVYRARDPHLERDVAIKIVASRLVGDAVARKRFEREARAVAALVHPNILGIHRFGNTDGVAFAVTELLEGETLRERLERQAIDPVEARALAIQMARGLAAAHEKGVLHRDLKPENLFVTNLGVLKILDFGLAKQRRAAPGTSGHHASSLSQSGLIVGTAGYMSPEQVRGEAADERSDVFAFGAVLYEMLSGRRAFARETMVETMAAILREDPPRLPAMIYADSPALAAIVDRCLEKEPGARYPNATELLGALEGSPATGGTTPRLKRYLGAVAVVGGIAMAVTLIPRLRPELGGVHPTGAAESRPGPLTFRTNEVDVADYALIPAGRFRMGAAGDSALFSGLMVRRAQPFHPVLIRQPYWMMRTEVTATQYRTFAKGTGSPMPTAPSFNEDWRLGEHPIVNVTWFDAKAYCEWAGGRLPTEAEWERAARATHDWQFVWGDQVVPLIDGKAQANVPDVSYVRRFGERKQTQEMDTYDDGFAATAPVGTFPPNDFGLYDMAGNVAEWVQDETIMPSRFLDESEGYEGRPPDGRAWEGGDGFVRVFRGGHWGSNGPVWMRDPGSAYGKFDGLGFRCVRESVPGSAERIALPPPPA